MAIYTSYGRYVKAKLFKDAMNTGGGIYMAFGMGNPEWDKTDNLPKVAPYNEEITQDSTSSFYDTSAKRAYYVNSSTPYEHVIFQGDSSLGNLSKRNPLFPVIYQPTEAIVFERYAGGTYTVNNNYYFDAHIAPTGNFDTYNDGHGGLASIKRPTSSDSTLLQSYYTSLYLKNYSLNHNMIGLLGMCRGDICLVKEISETTGSIKEFYYGDRYWKIIEPYEEDEELPCHVLISSSIEPNQLINVGTIDMGMIARQIAIYHKKESNPNDASVYKVTDYLFDFGQPVPSNIPADKILNLQEHNPDFELILNDYVKGSTRIKNQIDRYGYIVGF